MQLAKKADLEKQKEAALFVSSLSVSYSNRPDVLRDLSLTISPGERIGLIGANGAGKTTLFLSICGVLSPAGGNIHLFGKPVIPGEFRAEIGLVFQNPDDQLFCSSVWEDVAFGPENLGLSPILVQERVEKALFAAGILPLASRIPHQLSGGEKRMVAIASVLAMQPQLVLYDEPSANLDFRARRRLIRFLQQSSETIAVASHDLELILEVCDRVLLLNQGEIVTDGKPRDVMANRQLMERYGLEQPYSLFC